MKKVKHFLASLIAMSSLAALAGPAVPTTEEEPMRLTVGVGTAAGFVDGFHLNKLGGGLGFTHNVGHNIEYGVGIGGGLVGDKQLFGKGNDSVYKFGGGLMVRYMPEVAEKLHVGASLGFGVTRLFGEKATEMYKKVSLPVDMQLKVGLPVSYGVSDGFDVYFAPAFTMKDIRFVKEDEATKKMSNHMGAELAIGTQFNIGGPSMFVQVTPAFENFKAEKQMGFKLGAAVGVNFNL